MESPPFYDISKSLHIVFMVSWFAGLFYMARLFIYHVEAQDLDEPEKSILTKQYSLMEKRLWWIISTPAMALTLIFGFIMLILNPELLKQPWMYYKLGFVAMLCVYHFFCQKMYLDMGKNQFYWSSSALRIWNEVATLLLIIIVFIVVLKSTLNWVYASLAFIAVGLLLMLGINLYKSVLENKKKQEKLARKEEREQEKEEEKQEEEKEV